MSDPLKGFIALIIIGCVMTYVAFYVKDHVKKPISKPDPAKICIESHGTPKFDEEHHSYFCIFEDNK